MQVQVAKNMALAACLGFLVGCASTGKKVKHPDDPLLLARKPVQGTAESARPTLLARAEPVAPQRPALPEPSRLAQEPLPPPEPPGPELAPRPAPPRRQAFPASRRRVSGTFGHAEDFSWLQGVLTRSKQGGMQLRYLAPTPESAALGLMSLHEDPRLSAFRPGDVVMIEGEAQEPSFTRPYRIHSVWLVKRAE